MNLLKSILRYKCPKCREGDLFKKPFQFKDPVAMPEACPHCKASFHPEPGFYFGALFISYIVSSFLFLGIAGLLILVFDWTVNQAFVAILFVGALSYFKIMRLSRSVWIYIFSGTS